MMDFVGQALAQAGSRPSFLAVGTERALEGAPVLWIALNHAKGAGDHAIAAAVADIGLHEDATEFGAHERAGGARFQATRDLAVFADIGGELPGNLIGRVAALAGLHLTFHELHMPPRRVANGAGVVVGEAAPVHAVRRQVVPFLAGDFAGLAADAKRGVGQKAGGAITVLVRVFGLKMKQLRRWSTAHAILAVSRLNCSSTPASRRTPPGSHVAHQRLGFHDATLGSSEMASRSFTTSPFATALPSPVIGQSDLMHGAAVNLQRPHRVVTRARRSTMPRGVMMVTQSPCAMPSSSASSGEISQNNSGWSSARC